MTAAAVLAVTMVVVLVWTPARPRPCRPTARGRRRRPRWLLRRRRQHPPDLAAVVTEVASRLRTGTPPEPAWTLTVARALGPPPHAGGPPGRMWRTPADTGGCDDAVPAALGRLVEHCARDPGAQAAARTVVAASRLTHTLGAPLAEVLERCAATVAEEEQARDARRVALAGPRSTARILAGLPLLGLLLGAGLGADPLGSATDGGWGTASVLTGLLLLVAGRRWTAALVAAAEAPGHVGRRRSRAAAPR